MHERRCQAEIERLRSPERLARLELARVLDASFDALPLSHMVLFRLGG